MIKRKINVIIVCICLLLVLIISIFYYYPPKEEKLDYLNRFTDTKTQNYISTNSLTVLRETGIDTNTYEKIIDNTLLDDNYEYNANKSNCQNGSSVSWDSETKQFLVEATRPDNCYIYFDKIN